MNRRTISMIVSVAVLTGSIVTGCGSSVIRAPREEPQSPATQIDPFEFGDEFSLEPGSTPGGASDIERSMETGATTEVPVTAPGLNPDSPAVPADRTAFRVQLGGVFENREEADRYAERARRRLDTAVTVEYRAPFYRVFAGSFTARSDAETYVRFLKQEGFDESRWVPVTLTTP